MPAFVIGNGGAKIAYTPRISDAFTKLGALRLAKIAYTPSALEAGQHGSIRQHNYPHWLASRWASKRFPLRFRGTSFTHSTNTSTSTWHAPHSFVCSANFPVAATIFSHTLSAVYARIFRLSNTPVRHEASWPNELPAGQHQPLPLGASAPAVRKGESRGSGGGH